MTVDLVPLSTPVTHSKTAPLAQEEDRMGRGSPAGYSGIAAIVLACLGVSGVISTVTGAYVHWPFVLAGIVVGLWAVQFINRQS